jgi:hypothetical protein
VKLKMVKKEHVIAICLLALVVGFVTYPIWSPYLSIPYQPPVQIGGQVTLMVNLIDADDGSAVSPAGISVNFYEWTYGAGIPNDNIEPLTAIGPATETPDGEFTSSATTAEGSWVYVFIEDSGDTFYTTAAIRQVPFVLQQGISREAILDPIEVNPRTATSSDDVSIMVTSAGAEIDNSSAWAFGANDITVDVTASSGVSWGANRYIDPATGYLYYGGLLIFEYDLSTLRVVNTGGALLNTIEYGTTTYYIYEVGAILNDADVAGDGTWTTSISYDCTVGANNALDVHLIPFRRADQVNSASFGTSDTHYQTDDNMIDIDFATS